jgi:hypothetical protein
VFHKLIENGFWTQITSIDTNKYGVLENENLSRQIWNFSVDFF